MLNRKKELKRTAFRPKKREATGELALFIQLYAKQKGRCMVSGLRLLPPEHPEFHKQGSHCLPKGAYPEWRLREENVVMILPSFHDEWPFVKEKDDEFLRSNRAESWIPIVTYFRALREHVYTPSKPLPKKPQAPKKP